MNILHATTEPPLLQRLKQMLESANRADIAVGYFFVSGLDAVAAELGGLDKVRLLVGRTDRQTLEEVAAGLQQAEALRARLDGDGLIRRSERPGIAALSVESVARGVGLLPQTAESERAVRTLRDFIASGRIEIRTYPRGTLHAKAYLCWYPDHAERGAAVVGSSNFTLAGFTGNTELNVRVTGDAEMAELERWFNELWGESVDITADIADRLDRSWAIAQTPPYHVYLKALYELYREQLDTPELELRERTGPELANFQIDAVRRALRMIDQHGGCFIGDVVGLGKTYIGAELLRQLRFTERFDPLIICPAGLIPMWERTNELFSLGARVVSMSVIIPPPQARFDEELETYVDDAPASAGRSLIQEFPNRGPVLVDEAHNFRNLNSRRYRALTSYLQSGDHKVILISATPQNLGPKDIYHQLRLFLDERDHGLNLEPLDLADYFAAVQKWYEYRIELENWEEDFRRWKVENLRQGARPAPAPPQPPQPRLPYATIEQVLNPTFIRRRRRDIRELYGDQIEIAGKPVRFPEPVLENLPYRLDRVYAKAGRVQDLQAALASHQGARYDASRYVLPEHRTKPQYENLFRVRGRIARLIRYLLFKRLESSVAAFKSTLDTVVRSNRAFRECLDEGFVPIGKTATRLLSGETCDPDDLLAALLQEEQRRRDAGAARAYLSHPTSDFEVERWKADLDIDWQVLTRLRAQVEPITPMDDDKLQELRKFLARPEVVSGKILIFSEAATTVRYLHEELNPGGGDPAIAFVTGENRDSLQQIVKRFAPTPNLRPGETMPGKEIRVLIATDVVSEGQNLQDCNRVLNYDLHWNPVRLIQRFGRVDRIGTTFEQILLSNTWPDLDVDAELTLTERLLRRIQSFHDFIGLDTRLLSETERINPGAMYRIYADRRLPEQDDILDEVASFQRGIALLQRLHDENPDLWEIIEQLPDGIRAAMQAREPDREEAERERFLEEARRLGEAQMPLLDAEAAAARSPFDPPRAGESVVLLHQGDRFGAYAVDSRLTPRPVSPGQLIAAIECSEDEPAKPLPPDANERVMSAHGAFREDAAARLGRRRRPGSDTRLRRYLSKHLSLAREDFRDDPQELQRIGLLQRIFLDHLPAHVLEETSEVRRMQLTGLSLIRRLEALRQRHRLNPPEEEASSERGELEVVRIVCSEGLTEA
jgi:superfamily II DNA or RNA helicase/HKD family nuclease